MIAPMPALGYAVVTSDYQGPDMAWIAGSQTAHGVLDGIHGRPIRGAAIAVSGGSVPPARSRVCRRGQ
ncbi:lipase family protein [Nocardia tengchongensis]